MVFFSFFFTSFWYILFFFYSFWSFSILFILIFFFFLGMKTELDVNQPIYKQMSLPSGVQHYEIQFKNGFFFFILSLNTYSIYTLSLYYIQTNVWNSIQNGFFFSTFSSLYIPLSLYYNDVFLLELKTLWNSIQKWFFQHKLYIYIYLYIHMQYTLSLL